MKIILINPKVSMDNYDDALIFYKACKVEIDRYIPGSLYIEYRNQLSMVKDKIKKDSIIIVFNNRSKISYSNEIKSFFKDVINKNPIIWPIAIDNNCREPLEYIPNKQSYDVWEQLRKRNLNKKYIKTIGKIFARKIISNALPTFCKENCLLFMSHRRIDGENITAKLCDKFIIQAPNTKLFRDVISVEVGEDAQEKIDSALSKSDIFIFLHTKKSVESKWIIKELKYAILNNIPIIWIQIDNANINDLPFKLSEKPNLCLNSCDFFSDSKLTIIVDNILNQCFELIVLHSNYIFDYINNLEYFCYSSNLQLINDNYDYKIYHINCPRKGYKYPQRNIKQYIQFFGRKYDSTDLNRFKMFLEDKKYDSGVILTDFCKSKMKVVEENILEDNFDDFYSNWLKYINDKNINSNFINEIVISGAFPNSEELHKQILTSAIIIFSKVILNNGFTLVFGSHPTFQNIIFEISKQIRPKDYKSYVQMYISKYFKKQYNISNLSKNANINETENVENNRDKSLTKMRNKMISRKNVKALICLGGKTESKGIDEEIKIARKNNIPVFLIGSVGGRSSQLAVDFDTNRNWSELNNSSEELNKSLVYDFDYRKLINKVLNEL